MKKREDEVKIPLVGLSPTNPPEFRGGADALTNPTSNEQVAHRDRQRRQREKERI